MHPQLVKTVLLDVKPEESPNMVNVASNRLTSAVETGHAMPTGDLQPYLAGMGCGTTNPISRRASRPKVVCR